MTWGRLLDLSLVSADHRLDRMSDHAHKESQTTKCSKLRHLLTVVLHRSSLLYKLSVRAPQYLH